jgi:anti-sigma factor RsiW
MVSSLLDGGMTAGERERALAHLNSCGACHARFQSAQHLRQSLLEMDHARIPDELVGRLQVMASHERLRRLRRVNLSAFVGHWAGLVWLFFDNMMRPRALPFAGGVLSALLMLGVCFLPNSPFLPAAMASKQNADDVPLWQPSSSDMQRIHAWGYNGPSPLEVRTTGAGDAVLELTIDERGRVVDYTLVSGKMTPELGNMILLSRFNPATLFHRPTSGKLLYRLSQISVIG